MLRLLIGIGLLLMAVGFGAVGWQYWQGLPADPATESADRAQDTAVWLTSRSGVVVPAEDSRAYLVQDRLVPERIARLTVTAALEGLLVPGETLPAVPYLEVLADIRAPRVGQSLCPILTNDLAQSCVLHSARVVPGSVNALRGEASFAIELAYREDVAGVELPDLAAHVLEIEEVLPDLAVLPAPASVEAAVKELVSGTRAACEAEDRVATCRVLGLKLNLAQGGMQNAAARIAWLTPLPDGMTSLPILESLPDVNRLAH